MGSSIEDLIWELDNDPLLRDTPSPNNATKSTANPTNVDDLGSSLRNSPTHSSNNQWIELDISSPNMVSNYPSHPPSDHGTESHLPNSPTYPLDSITLDELITSLNEKNDKIEELTTTVARLEEELARMKQMFHRIAGSNKTATTNNQQTGQPISTSNNSDYRLSTDETLLNDSSENNSQSIEIPINQNGTVSVNVLSKSNPTTNVENQTRTNYLTTTVASSSNVYGHSSASPDAIDEIRRQKNQGEVQLGRSCRDKNRKTTTESSDLNRRNDDVTPPIASSSCVLPNGQTEYSLEFKKQNLSNSNSIVNQFLPFSCTTNETSAPVRGNGPINISLLHALHPLQAEDTNKTDRFTQLKDCRNKTPVLTIRSDDPLENISMKINIISRSGHGDFYGLYQFKETGDKGVVTSVDTIHRNIGSCDDKPTRIKLPGLEMQKLRDSDLELEKGKKNAYKLKSYPSGKEINIPSNGPQKLIKEYNLKDPRLCIRLFRNNIPIPDQPIFFSNPLIGSSRTQTKVAVHHPVHPNQTNTVPNNLNRASRINMKVSEDQQYRLSQPTTNNTFRQVSNIENSSTIEQSAMLNEQNRSENNCGQKRMYEGAECDYSLGLPIIKAPRMSTNNDE
ncbi:unnamed protein product [Adineta steineri]|uniref:Uncharacterized protein n=1 Tax=Adineta steineri TaxID=433720 RepID=A0A813UXQ9_9BILA|nr:unnamed protein product [Adineta steineri]CAF0942761.1 unnamed protein product [Adineta steineri]CAF0976451.1 unnamed protein product [Adineta steineri]